LASGILIFPSLLGRYGIFWMSMAWQLT